MLNKENWQGTQQRFTKWWNCEKMDRPLIWAVARREKLLEGLEQEELPKTPKEMHLSLDVKIPQMRNICRTHRFMADSFPYIDLNLGAGSMATYLGSEPEFAWDTIWFKECVTDWKDFNIHFDENNSWFKYHFNIIKQAQACANGEFLVAIPDIIENVDILSALRGPQEFCYDLIDEPELIKSLIDKIDKIYFKYYDRFYDTVKEKDGSCSYTAFHIWGQGKTAKVQCDFSAMMSPSQFQEFVLPSLKKQCKQLDNSIYHLDGKDAIRHIDALMQIKELNALQWTPGAGNPDGGDVQWYPLYEKVRAAGKSLWINIYDGQYEDWIKHADQIIDYFGNQGIYLIFPTLSENEANRLISRAEDKWSK